MANPNYYAPMLEEEQQFMNDRGEQDAKTDEGGGVVDNPQSSDAEGSSAEPQKGEPQQNDQENEDSKASESSGKPGKTQGLTPQSSQTRKEGDQRREGSRRAEPTHPSDKSQTALPANASEQPQSAILESGCNSLPNSYSPCVLHSSQLRSGWLPGSVSTARAAFQ